MRRQQRGSPAERGIPIAETSVEGFDRSIALLLRGPFLGIKYAIPHMESGTIINIASVSGITAGYSPHAYTAAKLGVVGLTKSVALELAERGKESTLFVLAELPLGFGFGISGNADRHGRARARDRGAMVGGRGAAGQSRISGRYCKHCTLARKQRVKLYNRTGACGRRWINVGASLVANAQRI